MTATSTAQEAGVSMPATPPRENLIRATSDIGLTRADGAAMPTLTGHFAVWDQWTEIRSAFEGNFMERFSPSSMTKTLSERSPKVLFQHGKDPQIGDKVLGAASRVEPDSTGAFYEVPLLDTSYNRDLIPGLEAGLYGASFRFSVLQEDVNKKPMKSDYNPRGIQERTVTEARVMEFGPVTFPAYAGATAGVRSLTDEFLLERLMEDDQIVERLAERLSDKQRVSVYFGGKPASVTYTSGTSANVTVEPAPVVNVNVEPLREETSLEPEPSEAATPETPGISTEPEPPAATTRSRTSLFWFVEDPKLKGAKQ